MGKTKFPKHSREMLVTTGATASFKGLLDAVLEPRFFRTARECGFTRINVQCGPDYDYFRESLEKLTVEDRASLTVDCLAFNPKGLIGEMNICKQNSSTGQEGLVISHAGAGTILDAMRAELDLVVVPNTTLLGNHQEDLALVLETLEYAVVGSLDNLPAAITRITQKSTKKADWDLDGHINSAMSIVDEEAGFA